VATKRRKNQFSNSKYNINKGRTLLYVFFIFILVFFYENNKAKYWRESNSECQNMDMELAVLNSYEDHRDAIEFIVNSGLYGYVHVLYKAKIVFNTRHDCASCI